MANWGLILGAAACGLSAAALVTSTSRPNRGGSYYSSSYYGSGSGSFSYCSMNSGFGGSCFSYSYSSGAPLYGSLYNPFCNLYSSSLYGSGYGLNSFGLSYFC